MVDEPWDCPYPSLKGSDYCIFHIHPFRREDKFNNQRNIELEQIKAIRQTGFIHILCTTAKNIDLSILSKFSADNTQIQIGYSTIVGEINTSNSTIDNYVVIDDCFVSTINSNRAVYNSSLRVQGSIIKDLNMSKTTINGQTSLLSTIFDRAKIIDTEFNNTVSLCDRIPDSAPLTNLDEFIGKKACKFESTPLFMGTQFNSGAIFAGVEFLSGANFNHSEFQGGCTFKGANFNIGCHFGFAEFDEETAFIEADLGTANFEKTTFNGPALFDNASFGSGRTYSFKDNIENHANVEGISLTSVSQSSNVLDNFVFGDGIVSVAGKAASFDNTKANDLMSIKRANADGLITAFSAHFYFLEISLQFDSSSPTISFFGSEIDAGTVRLTHEDSFYEWANTTVGDVSIVSDIDKNPFQNIFIENTRFDGFNFSDYREELREIDWVIDGYVHDNEHNESDYREATYAKAKTGAELVGDNYTESKFFIKEQRSRRSAYLSDLRDSGSISAYVKKGYNYLSNLFYDISCVYAESPRRVFTWATWSIILFAIIYSYLDVPLKYRASITVPPDINFLDGLNIRAIEISGIEYVVFSLESFTAFMVGHDFEVTNSLIRFIISIQAFSGTFLVALFVATIVRSVKR